MSLVQISDFFGSYPASNDEFLSSKIAAKEEFRELAPDVTEAIPERGELFKHQILSMRLAMEYDRILNISESGVGKTCAMIAVAEHLKRIYFANPNDKTLIKRTYVLVKNKFLIQNTISQITCTCTSGIYENEIIRNAPDEKTIKAEVKKLLKEWYTIISYSDFAKMVRKQTREEQLEEFMSNIVIFVDEIHNVVTLKDIRKAQIEIEDLDETDIDVTQESIYDTLYRAFHKGKRNKIYGFTAGPMINKPADIRPLINLFLPESNLMPNFTDAQMEAITIDQIKQYFLGIVLFIRALDTGAVAVDPENSSAMDGFFTKIYDVHMSTFEYGIYVQSLEGNNKKLISENLYLEDNDKSSAFFDRQRNISNFVFPDGSYGVKGSSKFLEKIGSDYQIKNDSDGNYFREYVKMIPLNPVPQITSATSSTALTVPTPAPAPEEDVPTRLSLLSAKFASILKICSDAYPTKPLNEIELSVHKGVIFIFFPDFVQGSAAITLAKVMEQNGYSEFKEITSIYTAGSGKALSLCASEKNSTSRVIRAARILPAKRYALLTGQTSDAAIRTIIDTNHSYENRYGHYLQVIIGSKAAREGINIYNAIAFIRVSSGWNPTSDRQARDRVFRADSHDVRIAELREDELRRGVITNENDKTIFPVTVYNMAAVYVPPDELNTTDLRKIFPNLSEDSFKSLVDKLSQADIDTIDIHMYKRSELKDRAIRRIFRFMKQCSIDCVINLKRNIRPTDVNGSPICDYTTCDYTCLNARQDIINNIDKTTKILYYSGEEVANAIFQIKNLFSQYYSLSISQIFSLIPGIESIYVTMGLEKMITDNIRITDRFGIYGYLREGNQGVIYIEKDPFQMKSRQENVYYNSSIIGTYNQKYDLYTKYINSVYTELTDDMLNQLNMLNPNSIEFENIIMDLSLNTKISLVERAIIESTSGNARNPTMNNKILYIFANFIYSFPEPTREIEEVSQEYAAKSMGRGRPFSKKERKIVQSRALESFTSFSRGGETIIVHILDILKGVDSANYSLINKFLKADCAIRLYKKSENIGFRNTNMYENYVYSKMISEQTSKKLLPYENYPFYGILLDSNVMNIRNRATETEKILSDERYRKHSKACVSYSKVEILDMMYQLGMTPPNITVPENYTRQQLILDIQSKFRSEELDNYDFTSISDEVLVYMYKWYIEGTGRANLCSRIEKDFIAHSRIFNLFNLITYTSPSTVAPVSTIPSVTGTSSNSFSLTQPLIQQPLQTQPSLQQPIQAQPFLQQSLVPAQQFILTQQAQQQLPQQIPQPQFIPAQQSQQLLPQQIQIPQQQSLLQSTFAIPINETAPTFAPTTSIFSGFSVNPIFR